MIKRLALTLTALAILSTAALAGDWNIDKVHSSVGFEVRHMVISKTKGTFTDFSGVVKFEENALEVGSVEFTIQVASIDTDDEKRDGHLKSPDFFDAATYPEMTFVSKKITKGEGNSFAMTGDMTMRGVTKEVTFDCEFNGVINLGEHKKAGFSATTKIDRQDFGISFSKTLDQGGLAVGNEVTISIEIEANLAGS